MEFPDARILVVCKAPVPGEVKTRLLSVLSATQAADLHAQLAHEKIELVRESNLAPIELWCAPTVEHPFFSPWRDHGVALFNQRGTDLGERMGSAMQDCLEHRASSAVLIGTDCPPLDAAYLRYALSQLTNHDAVIGPAEDGGYGLIGLRQFDPAFFADIPWGTQTVCADTCRRYNLKRLNWALLPLLWDIDRPEDLQRHWGGQSKVPE